MTGVRSRIGLVVVLLMILIPAVYVLADETYTDSDRFTVNTAEIDGDIQFEDVTGCSVRMQVTNHGDDFEGTLKILRYESTDGSYVSAVGRTVHIRFERFGNGVFFRMLAQLHILPKRRPQPKKCRKRNIARQIVRNFSGAEGKRC